MGNRCQDCNKFVSLETDEPEEDSIDVSSSGTVSIEVTIRRNCADCGSEMKSAVLDAEEEIDGDWVEEHAPHGEWSVENTELELTESGGGRYAKNLIGFHCWAKVDCPCGAIMLVELSAEEAASAFEDSQ